ncbi:MAG: cytochrome P450 [Acidimicrobiales bacterium]
MAAIDLTDLRAFEAGFPHELFDGLRAEAPVRWHAATEHTPDGEGFWSVTSHAHCATAGADLTTFSSMGGGGRAGGGTILEDLPIGFAAGVLFNMMDDPRHQRIRRLLSPLLTPKALAPMEAELRVVADDAVAHALAAGEVDVVAALTTELPLRAMALLLGVPAADRHQLAAWADATLSYDHRALGEDDDASRAASAGLFAYGATLLDAKRRAPGDDLLSALVHGELPADAGEPRLSELELQMAFTLLVAAGAETTRNSLAIGIVAMAEHPEQWRHLRADAAAIPMAVEEVLRWSSTTPYDRRTATVDTTLGGKAIKAGDKVALWWAAANRDPAVFDAPHRFDVRRDPNPHLAFGYGGHACVGAGLARRELRLVFAALAATVTTIELVAAPTWRRSNKHTGLHRATVALT